MDQSQLVENVVEQVLRRLNNGGGGNVTTASPRAGAGRGAEGVFEDAATAIEAATQAQRQLVEAGVETRDQICRMLRRIPRENARQWGRLELDETQVGRLDHKIAKLELLDDVPGVEFLQTQAHSGDEGVSLDEFAPWGVIGVITPVTHVIPTLTANAINMVAAGNALVINPHPSGAGCAAEAVRTYNRAIAERFGIENLICAINPPTLESANAIFEHESVRLLCVTGGPAVARAALSQQKRAIVAGPGNPPVVVDETADLDNAARSIIQGGGFDNNLLCIGEKEVFVVESVFDRMMQAMERAGAVRLQRAQISRLADAAFDWQQDHYALSKELVGQGCDTLARAAGASAGPDVDLLFGETDESSPFVAEEQMMPFVPFVRVRDADEAIDKALRYEHGFGHTACIHSNNLNTITRMGRAMNVSVFVVNGPSTGGLGIGGEGYPSYSIATPTGEGITNPLTFTRFRRAAISGSLRMI